MGVEFTYMLAVFVGWPSSPCAFVFPQIAVFLCCMQPCAVCALWIAVLPLVDCVCRWVIIRTRGWGQMMEQNWPCHNALELRRPSFARREESFTEKGKCKNLSDTSEYPVCHPDRRSEKDPMSCYRQKYWSLWADLYSSLYSFFQYSCPLVEAAMLFYVSLPVNVLELAPERIFPNTQSDNVPNMMTDLSPTVLSITTNLDIICCLTLLIFSSSGRSFQVVGALVTNSDLALLLRWLNQMIWSLCLSLMPIS